MSHVPHVVLVNIAEIPDVNIVAMLSQSSAQPSTNCTGTPPNHSQSHKGQGSCSFLTLLKYTTGRHSREHISRAGLFHTRNKIVLWSSVCKESVRGGARTCQSVSTCTREYCTTENVCEDNISSVASDCYLPTSLTTCKELAAVGPHTCQPVSTCQSPSPCSEVEYCAENNACQAQVLCISSADCGLLSVCKETTYGGSCWLVKTCQDLATCSSTCSGGQY